MPKQIPGSELDALIEIVNRLPETASVDEIARAADIDLPRRTLQRRLATLVKGGRLVLEGRGRGSRYRVPPGVAADVDVVASTAALGKLTAGVRVDVGIPVSPEGKSIRRAVRAPIHERRPVGCDRAFLDRYRANETFYLPPEIRSRLRELGVRTA